MLRSVYDQPDAAAEHAQSTTSRPPAPTSWPNSTTMAPPAAIAGFHTEPSRRAMGPQGETWETIINDEAPQSCPHPRCPTAPPATIRVPPERRRPLPVLGVKASQVQILSSRRHKYRQKRAPMHAGGAHNR